MRSKSFMAITAALLNRSAADVEAADQQGGKVQFINNFLGSVSNAVEFVFADGVSRDQGSEGLWAENLY